MVKPLERIISTAKALSSHVVLSEAEDPRIVQGALRAARDGIARVTLIGNRATIARHLAGCDSPHMRIEDPADSPLTATYAAAYQTLRRSRGITAYEAEEAMRSSLSFAAMMVRQGDADGSIGGAVATTAETVRTALQIIGRAPGASLVSSFNLMLLCEQHHPKNGAFVFADCGLVIEPSAAELAEIAVASANSYTALVGQTAKVAMLSFSTHGSASHAHVSRVIEATQLARYANPELIIDGEIQFDAAFVESVGTAKAPDSALQGAANVFVFPNLEAANIGYKIAQRIGGATALGPILQGLAKPANDLSRGCSVDDVYHAIAITAVQAAEFRSDRSTKVRPAAHAPSLFG